MRARARARARAQGACTTGCRDDAVLSAAHDAADAMTAARAAFPGVDS